MNETKREGKRFVRVISLLLVCVTLLCGCASNDGGDRNEPSDYLGEQYDLMSGISPSPIPEKLADDEFYYAYRSFCSDLFEAVCKNTAGNTAVSPMALMQTLLAAANGANGKTQSEILHAVASLVSIGDLNSYTATHITKLERDPETNISTSIWINGANNVFKADKSFLQLNSSYFLSDMYLADMSAEASVSYVSRWLGEKIGVSGFDGTAFIDGSSSVGLIGGFSGNYSWTSGFGGKTSGTFVGENGSVETEFMTTTATSSIKIGYAVGFSKKLSNGYTFAALLPQSGLTCDTLSAYLTPERIKECYTSAQNSAEFNVIMPEFSCTASPELSAALESMGIKAIFDSESSDLGGFGTFKNNLSVSAVYSPISISFGANGIGFSKNEPSAPLTSAPHNGLIEAEYRFDRPFVYILYDTDGYPLVMGKITDIVGTTVTDQPSEDISE